MTYDELVRHFGGTQEKAAAALGCGQSVVSLWKTRGKVPDKWQYKAEIISGGALRADPELRTVGQRIVVEVRPVVVPQ